MPASKNRRKGGKRKGRKVTKKKHVVPFMNVADPHSDEWAMNMLVEQQYNWGMSYDGMPPHP